MKAGVYVIVPSGYPTSIFRLFRLLCLKKPQQTSQKYTCVHKYKKWNRTCKFLSAWLASCHNSVQSVPPLAWLLRKMKVVVDIVAQKMQSENDVHVARNYLMKILRSSMRYSTDFTSASLLFHPSDLAKPIENHRRSPLSQPLFPPAPNISCIVLVF